MFYRFKTSIWMLRCISQYYEFEANKAKFSLFYEMFKFWTLFWHEIEKKKSKNQTNPTKMAKRAKMRKRNTQMFILSQ